MFVESPASVCPALPAQLLGPIKQANFDLSQSRNQTRKCEFLAQMEKVTPCRYRPT